MCELACEGILRFRGHFNQRERPELQEELRLEMVDKEEARAKKAKKTKKAYEAGRKKWVSARWVADSVDG
jgi:hypothetical protein